MVQNKYTITLRSGEFYKSIRGIPASTAEEAIKIARESLGWDINNSDFIESEIDLGLLDVGE